MPRAEPLHQVARIDAATCKRLLADYLKVGFALRVNYSGLNDHEIRATTEEAILEAYLSYKPERGKTEGAWVRQVIRWRLDTTARKSALTAWDRDADALDTDPQVLNGVNPERAFHRAHALRALEELSPRHQTILIARMGGDTYEEIGEQLGISRARAHTEGKRALEQLRQILDTPTRGRRTL